MPARSVSVTVSDHWSSSGHERTAMSTSPGRESSSRSYSVVFSPVMMAKNSSGAAGDALRTLPEVLVVVVIGPPSMVDVKCPGMRTSTVPRLRSPNAQTPNVTNARLTRVGETERGFAPRRS